MKIHFLKRYPGSFLLFIAFSFLLAACRNDSKEAGISITGALREMAGRKIVLKELEPKSVRPVDSVTAGPEGVFAFSLKAETAGFYLLDFGDRRELPLCLEKDDSLKIEGSLAALPAGISLTGSPGTEILHDFYLASSPNKEKVDSLKRVIQSAEGTPEMMQMTFSADSLYATLLNAQRELEKKTIEDHQDKLAVLLILNYTLGATPVLTLDEDLDVYQKLTALETNYPGNKHVEYHRQRIREFMERKAGPRLR